jgi:hypothetical protein
MSKSVPAGSGLYPGGVRPTFSMYRNLAVTQNVYLHLVAFEYCHSQGIRYRLNGHVIWVSPLREEDFTIFKFISAGPRHC